jgi:serine/threonine-protein kinase
MLVCAQCNAVYDDAANFCRTDGLPLVPLAAETHIATGEIVNESLRIVERLRTDRFGVVYRVEDQVHAGSSYALRLFNRGLVNSLVFSKLSMLAALLRGAIDDPDILTGYIPIQLEDGRYALLYDDCPGTLLEAVIRREAPLTPDFVVTTLLRIADVLNSAHRADLVHGDVTPENILVTGRSDRGLSIKLLDFGIVSTIRAYNPRAIAIQSTGAGCKAYDNYFAPELVTGRGAAADERTEVFSLGALCYHMLSGWIPFSDAAIEGASAVYATADPRPLVVLSPQLGVPRALEQTMLRAMELDPSARHASLGELVEELQEIQLDLSITPPAIVAEAASDAGARPSDRSTEGNEASESVATTGELAPERDEESDLRTPRARI